jgi:hypothetical protein
MMAPFSSYHSVDRSPDFAGNLVYRSVVSLMITREAKGSQPVQFGNAMKRCDESRFARARCTLALRARPLKIMAEQWSD